MHLEFKRLTQIKPADITALNNHPKVLQQMPLGSPDFDDGKSRNWTEEKDAQWEINGYGPWAFVIDDVFAGWGGLQKEGDDADLALVLHPDFWGTGKIICDEIIRHAFDEIHLTSITILLPLSRKVSRFITRYGFQPDGSVNYDGVDFRRFRLFSDHTDGHD